MAINVKVIKSKSGKPSDNPRVVGDKLYNDFRRACADLYRPILHAVDLPDQQKVWEDTLNEAVDGLDYLPVTVKRQLKSDTYKLKYHLRGIFLSAKKFEALEKKVLTNESLVKRSAAYDRIHSIESDFREWFRENKGEKVRLSLLLHEAAHKYTEGLMEVLGDDYPDLNKD